ncbi:MAG: hypothetical protein P4L50_20430 [Anaerolineaceae bacterium]|nr:hypothetical protein [Anaerolineaceae bacterium]
MKFSFPRWTVPLVLLVVSILSFGLLIPHLGFYLDDWRPIYAANTQGPAGVWKFFAFDARPLAALLYLPLDSILGYSPINWQLFELACRWLTVLALWQALRLLWPKHIQEVTWTALLFAVYPVFKQMPISVTYTEQWVGFLAYAVSILAMILSLRWRKGTIPFTLLGMVLAGYHMITLEYFVGLEFLRPVFLWIALSPRFVSFRKRAVSVLLHWLPYLFLLGVFIVWRLFLINLPIADRNHPDLLFGLIAHPKYYGTQLVQIVFQDLSNIFFTTWYNTIQPSLFSLQKSSALKTNLLFWGVAAAASVLTIFYLLHLHKANENESDEGSGWHAWWVPAMLLSGLGVLLGHAPAWALGRQASQANTLWADRFALPAMFGASLFIVASFRALFKNKTQGIVVISILVGLACGANLRNGNDFVQSWNKQLSLYWQLEWRAPSLAQPTAILSPDEVLSKMGEYPTSMAIGMLYPAPKDLLGEADKRSKLGYWFFSVSNLLANPSTNLQKLLSDSELYETTNSFEFDAFSADSIAMTFDSQPGQCLWVINPDDKGNPQIPSSSNSISSISNLKRISDTTNTGFPSRAIFGNEPAHSWCYYFEKADLSRQMGQWSKVVSLWNDANKAGYGPLVGFEYNPFILALAHEQDWASARQLTEKAGNLTPSLHSYLCSLWQRIDAETSQSAARDDAEQAVRSELACPQP